MLQELGLKWILNPWILFLNDAQIEVSDLSKYYLNFQLL
jgi:hypothetical protein